MHCGIKERFEYKSRSVFQIHSNVLYHRMKRSYGIKLYDVREDKRSDTDIMQEGAAGERLREEQPETAGRETER